MVYRCFTEKKSGFDIEAQRVLKDLKDNLGNIIRSFITGAIIGFLPGLGGSTSSVLAYSNEKKLAKNKEEWGHGAVGGVIAPEVANNSGIGGAMIPMIALGIPGNGVMSLFMTALMVHGIETGPLFMRNKPDIVYMMFAMAILAAVVILIFEIVGMPLFPALLRCPYHYLYPAIIIICFMGAYLTNGNLFGFVVALATTALGVAMSYFKLPTMPFVLSFILCSILEKNFRSGMNMASNGFASFFTHPISCIFIIIGTVMLFQNIFMPSLKARFKGKNKEAK